MTESNYIDIAAMQKRIDERKAEQSKRFKAHLQSISSRESEGANELSNLLTKAAISGREDNNKKRAAEMEIEKARAIAEVEAKYERESGVKAEDTLKLEAAYKSMLGNIPGINKK